MLQYITDTAISIARAVVWLDAAVIMTIIASVMANIVFTTATGEEGKEVRQS